MTARLPGRPLGGIRGPFKGFSRLRVVDFTKLLPGPYATQILADMGCRVRKLELPYFADAARQTPPLIDGVGSTYWMVNQRKKLLSVDFRKPAGLKKVLRLVAGADVLVEGSRPGLMDRIGLGSKDMRRLNKRLVYCSLGGYPPEGPWSRKAGHDLNFLAVSGFLGLEGAGARVPVTQVADLAGSLAAVSSIMAALVERQRTGRGRHVQISISEAAHSWLPVALGELRAEGRDPSGSTRWWNGRHPFYRLYETADGGRLAVAALEKPVALSLLDALGLGELRALLDDSAANAERLISELSRLLRTATAQEWSRRLQGKDVCVTPVYDIEQAAVFQDWLRG
ncbi:MAG: CoA transferase [Planctomycetota bacterium]